MNRIPAATCPPPRRATAARFWPGLVGGLTGAWLAVTLVKFGNPIILDQLIEPPKGFWEFVFDPWPVAWGYGMLAGLVGAGATIARLPAGVPRALSALPALWFAWQLAAALHTVDLALTHATLLHFGAAIVCFYFGLYVLGQVECLTGFWLCLLAGFAWVLWMGFGQHFGGLEATREMMYAQPNWSQLSPEQLRRIASNRIFSTLVYPNALAGAILLFLPMLMAVTSRLTERLPNIYRGVLVGLLGYAGLACLYWSGSKSGWLIALGLALVCWFRQTFGRRLKWTVAAVVLLIGLAGFGIKFSGYFRKGAPSVTARADYWRAALQITREHPLFGTGPGTFSIPYKQIKAPESEMTRLAHNNYLEQACDTGIVGFLTFCALVIGLLVRLYRKSAPGLIAFSVWLGLLGWALQGLVEFGLYIPALAWPAFLLFGWLLGTDLKSTRPN